MAFGWHLKQHWCILNPSRLVAYLVADKLEKSHVQEFIFTLSSNWWLNHPFENVLVKFGSFPQFSGWKFRNYLSCHHLVMTPSIQFFASTLQDSPTAALSLFGTLLQKYPGETNNRHGIPQQRPTSHDSLVGWFPDDINDIINPYRVDDHPELYRK